MSKGPPIPPKITKLIKESGNTFHAEAARLLKSLGWEVTVSPYYMDQAQNKAREIDLVAVKREGQVTTPGGKPRGEILVRLFIECKFVHSCSVFWFADKDREAAERLVCGTKMFPESNTFTSQHHYLATNPEVGKLFASEKSKGSESDPYYRAMNQVLNATIAMGGGPIPNTKRSEAQPVLEFPVIVCSSFSSMYKVLFFADSQPVQIQDNFQLEVQYAYHDRSGMQRNEYFLIDVVALEQLPTFCEVIRRDAELAALVRSG